MQEDTKQPDVTSSFIAITVLVVIIIIVMQVRSDSKFYGLGGKKISFVAQLDTSRGCFTIDSYDPCLSTMQIGDVGYIQPWLTDKDRHIVEDITFNDQQRGSATARVERVKEGYLITFKE